VRFNQIKNMTGSGIQYKNVDACYVLDAADIGWGYQGDKD